MSHRIASFSLTLTREFSGARRETEKETQRHSEKETETDNYGAYFFAWIFVFIESNGHQ